MSARDADRRSAMNARAVPGSAEWDGVNAASDALKSGEVIAMPTDTVYGLAADATNAEAVRRLFALKGRPAHRSIAVLATDSCDVERLVEMPASGRRLAKRFWPGPLTLVAPRSAKAPVHLGDATTMGVRVPDHDIVRSLAVPNPLAVTSANLHGEPTPPTAQEVARLFPRLSVVVDGGPLPGRASTVVDVTGSTPAVLRAGPISAEEIAAILGSA